MHSRNLKTLILHRSLYTAIHLWMNLLFAQTHLHIQIYTQRTYLTSIPGMPINQWHLPPHFHNMKFDLILLYEIDHSIDRYSKLYTFVSAIPFQ